VTKKRDPKAQEALQVAIHELRKVASRLEIDVAVSERDQMAARHIPIPSHRAMKDGIGNEIDGDDFDDGQDFGNGGQPKQNQHQHQQRRKLQHQRRPMPSQQQGGGGSGGGGAM
jgi:hypothetical protein